MLTIAPAPHPQTYLDAELRPFTPDAQVFLACLEHPSIPDCVLILDGDTCLVSTIDGEDVIRVAYIISPTPTLLEQAVKGLPYQLCQTDLANLGFKIAGFDFYP